MFETIILKNPYPNGFPDDNDPVALDYLSRITMVKEALMEDRLYGHYIDGDRKGSIVKFIPDPAFKKCHILEPSIQYASSPFQKGPWYRFENNTLWVIATWTGRKNRVKETISYRNYFELMIGDGIQTVWAKFDAKTAKDAILQNPDQRDIDGKLLNIGDSVMFINARYGSRMVLERGTIKDFKVTVDSKKTSISTIIEGTTGVLSTLSHPTDMVCKI